MKSVYSQRLFEQLMRSAAPAPLSVDTPIENAATYPQGGGQEVTASDALKVLCWFRNEREECGGEANPYSYYFPEKLSLRMQRGRKAGYAKAAGSPEVWKIEQPPIELPETRIKHCLQLLVDYGLLWFGTLQDNKDNITDYIFWLND